MSKNQPAVREALPQSTTPALPRMGQRGRRLFLAGLLLVLLLFPLLQVTQGTQNYWLHMLLFVFMYITMASSWNIIGGYGGYISLGHSVFYAVGAYTAGALLVYQGFSPFLTAILGGVLAMALGFLAGLITLRTRASSFIIATLAFALMFTNLLDHWDLLGGANGLSLPLIPVTPQLAKIPFYYAMLLVAVLTIYLSYRIRHSKFGLGLRALSQDETKAEVAGIPTRTYKVLAFAISAFPIGVVGALWGYYLTYLEPLIFLALGVSADMVLMSILGGRGTVAGPVIGAVLLVALNEAFLANLGSSELNIVGTGVIMILALLFFPEGVVGTLREHGRLPSILDWD